jgi:hypothetical protein
MPPTPEFQDIVQMSIEKVSCLTATKRLRSKANRDKYDRTVAARDVRCYGENRELGIRTVELAPGLQPGPVLN